MLTKKINLWIIDTKLKVCTFQSRWWAIVRKARDVILTVRVATTIASALLWFCINTEVGAGALLVYDGGEAWAESQSVWQRVPPSVWSVRPGLRLPGPRLPGWLRRQWLRHRPLCRQKEGRAETSAQQFNFVRNVEEGESYCSKTIFLLFYNIRAFHFII